MNGNYMNKLESIKPTVAITAPQQWMNNKNNRWLLMDKEPYLSLPAKVVNQILRHELSFHSLGLQGGMTLYA